MCFAPLTLFLVCDLERSEGRAEALSQANDDAKQQIEDAVRAKNDAEVPPSPPPFLKS